MRFRASVREFVTNSPVSRQRFALIDFLPLFMDVVGSHRSGALSVSDGTSAH